MSAAAASRPTRLLWLIDSLTVGGAESLMVPFVRHLDRSRYELFVCCLTSISGNAIEPLLREQGIAVTNLGARNLRDVAAFRRLLALLRAERIDLVHAHLTYASIWAAVASRLTGVPSVTSLHVAPPDERGREASRDRLMRFVTNRWSARVIAVSDALRQDYLAGGGIRPGKLVTVHNGIELDRFARERAECRERITREFGIPGDARIAVTVSVLRPGKGIEYLIEAAKHVLSRVPDAWFLIVGDGSMREQWAALAGADDRVVWAGYRADVDAILAGCDVFVLPSLADAFPTVLLEAMAAGLPVVATRVGGIPEIVEPDVTGRLVPPGDANALADAISGVLADSDTRHRMSSRARDTARTNFTTDAWIARLENVYAEATR